MGMPSINITFTELAKNVIGRSGGKVIGLIIPGTAGEKNMIKIAPGDEVPEEAKLYKNQIEMSLVGGEEKPKKAIVCFAGEEFVNIDDALHTLEDEKVDYIALDGTAEGIPDKLIEWIKEQRKLNKPVKAVLAGKEADHEAIINYATESVVADGKTYTGEKFCGRIAGLLAGTPITQSSTYCLLPEVTDCTRIRKQEMDEEVDNGKMILFYSNGEVRVARGVNSLMTTDDKKGQQYKKIKIVDIMDTIRSDITSTIRNEWIGKKANTYDNKCLLVSAIQGYLDNLVLQCVLESASVEIDADGNKKYLESKNEDTTEMSEDELKKANTGENVFLKATIKMVDAIEDITLDITV